MKMKCKGTNCDKKHTCLRYLAPVDKQKQEYMSFKPVEPCMHYVKAAVKKRANRKSD